MPNLDTRQRVSICLQVCMVQVVCARQHLPQPAHCDAECIICREQLGQLAAAQGGSYTVTESDVHGIFQQLKR